MRWVVAVGSVVLVAVSSVSAQPPIVSDPLVPPVVTAAPAPAIDLYTPVSNAGNYFYADVELLMRWFKPVCAGVPIVSVGNPQDAVPGALGQPGTLVVVGGAPPHKFEFPMTPGIQLTLGWGRGDGSCGFEIGGFLMEEASNSQTFRADPNGFPFSYLPYQAPDNSFQALPFTIPGLTTGSSVAVGSTKIWGVESNITIPFAIDRGSCTLYCTVLVGARYLDLTDRVRITNTLQLVADPSAFAVGMDEFRTHNQFAGPQLGTTIGVARGRWAAELTTKFAAGLTEQTRIIEGSPLASASVLSPVLVPGPIQALPSNINRARASRVTLVPEMNFKTRAAVTSWCTLTLGYSLLYWNKVLCPGDQMSPLVNVTQLPFRGPVTGTRDPKPPFNHTDYFAQGWNVGVEFRY